MDERLSWGPDRAGLKRPGVPGISFPERTFWAGALGWRRWPGRTIVFVMDSGFGRRLREHRESYGFSAAELAQISGLKGARIGKLEHGDNPTAYEVELLARSLAIDPRSLLDPNAPPDPKRSAARFRAPLGVSAIGAVDMRLLARAAEIARIGGFLAEQLGREAPAIAGARRILPVRGNEPAWRQGYDLGEQDRELLLPGDTPIESVQAAFESLGIHIAFVDFESPEIESASLYEQGALPVILLNRHSDRVKYELSRRAILAHELCHLLHDGGERDLLAAISREEDQTHIESRANAFAPSFLAPRRFVSVEGIDAKAKVLQLAYLWGFTFEGAVWHAKNIELIGTEDAGRLLKERRYGATIDPPFERRVDRLAFHHLVDPADVSSLVYGLISDVTVEAYAQGIISSSRAREILTAQ